MSCIPLLKEFMTFIFLTGSATQCLTSVSTCRCQKGTRCNNPL